MVSDALHSCLLHGRGCSNDDGVRYEWEAESRRASEVGVFGAGLRSSPSRAAARGVVV